MNGTLQHQGESHPRHHWCFTMAWGRKGTAGLGVVEITDGTLSTPASPGEGGDGKDR